MENLKRNIYQLKNNISLFLIVIFLSSCSSMESFKFWENGEVDIDEPRKLEKFSSKYSVKNNWKISFNNAENTLGNFVPSFNASNIFFADSSGVIYSIDSESGQVNWETQSNFLSSGVSSGFGILVVSDVDGNVIAHNQNDGSVLWTSNVKSEVLAPAAIDAKFVIIKTGSGELLALDKNSGELQWSYRSKLPNLTIRGSSSPIISDEQIFVSFDNGRLGVFQLDTGFPIWDGAISYPSGTSELESLVDSDSSPLVEGGLVYTTNYQGNLNVFDLAQKRSVWTSESSSFFSPVILKGVLAVVEANSSMKTFFMKSLQPSWNSDEYLNREISNAISFKGQLVVGDLDGYIHIIDPLNGSTTGREKISRKPIKTIISRSNNFYVIDEGFNIFSLSI
jgi:outer membrane protein assembly factor BamB